MKKLNKVLSIVMVAAALGFTGFLVAKAATRVVLGSGDNFVILAGSTVTNTGSSVITGDLGLHPGTSVTGFPPGIVNGTQHVTDSTALAAKNDLITAYNNAAGQTPTTTVATELGGSTKNAGIYNSSAGTFGITGTLTLDGQGDHNAVFIFKTASTLITAGSSTVALVNGAQACNVFWQVGSSATLGTNSTFKGNILALTSATLTTGANVEGRILARNGAVTLDTNTISKPACDTSATTTTTTTTTTAATDAAATEAAAAEAAAAAAAAANGVGGTATTPKLAKAGIAPEQKTNPLAVAIPAGILVSLVFVAIRRKRTA